MKRVKNILHNNFMLQNGFSLKVLNKILKSTESVFFLKITRSTYFHDFKLTKIMYNYDTSLKKKVFLISLIIYQNWCL